MFAGQPMWFHRDDTGLVWYIAIATDGEAVEGQSVQAMLHWGIFIFSLKYADGCIGCVQVRFLADIDDYVSP
jgi:hypothetical protein